MKSRTLNLGFTLVELMLTVAIAGVLISMAVPAYTGLIKSNKLTSKTNDLITSLNIARSEAIKRNLSITVARSGANWEDGWRIFIDTNGNNTYQSGTDTELRIYDSISLFSIRKNGSAGYIEYSPNGQSTSMTSFAVCDTSDGNMVPDANAAKLISINITGRPRLKEDTNNDGIPNIDSTTNLTSCTPS